MSFLLSARAELIKTRRSASFWVSLLGAGVIPLVFMIAYLVRPDQNAERLKAMPWESHFFHGWQNFSSFLLPLFVILICTQIPQIEYKNNSWKQVFSSPQTIGNIFFSKYAAVGLMILFLFLSFNIFMIGSAIIANLIYPKFSFLKSQIDWGILLRLNVRTFVSLLGIISLQYWLSLRFRNFVVPIGFGLGLLVTAMIVLPFTQVSHHLPYSYPVLTFMLSANKSPEDIASLKYVEWGSVIYFLIFTLLGFLDMRYRKERG